MARLRDELEIERDRASCKVWRARNLEYDRKRKREYYASDRGKEVDRNRRLDGRAYKKALHWRRQNPEKSIWYNAKVRASRKGIEFKLMVEDIVIPKLCPILGLELKTAERGHGSKLRFADNSPSLDRIDPGKGYIPGNVHVVSFRANVLKGDGTAEEHRLIADYIDQHETGG